MKKLVSVLFLITGIYACFPLCVTGQGIHITDNRESIFFEDESSGWLRIKPGIQISPTEIFPAYNMDLGLGPNDELILEDTKYDELGFSHYTYQLHHRGVKVAHAQIIVHASYGKVEKLNGFLPQLNQTTEIPTVSVATAIQLAKIHVPANTYMWELPELEQIIKKAKNDPNATFYPQPELMWIDEDFDWSTHNYTLGYELAIFTSDPQGSMAVFVDAFDGSIIKEINTFHTIDSEGTAETKYSGTQSIVTDSTATGFRLRESGRAAGGIETYNIQNGTNLGNAVDFWDTDNYWDNFNADIDEVATDVHWGSEMTFDYFNDVHQWNSFNGSGGAILSYVHYGDFGTANAFWNVYYAGYYDGGGSPVTALDIVGHEFTHGVVRNTCNLIYIDESAALNEGHADIFGELVENYVDSSAANWLAGNPPNVFRSMISPKSFSNPDTYKGQYWYTGNSDNGGAHNNSTVLSHWFYLLAAGDSGVNDNGDTFHIEGIGPNKAEMIAWRNLSQYMGPTSQFRDVRAGTIEAAEDFFGICSFEAIQTINAWHAVGVGEPIKDGDLGALELLAPEDCGLTDSATYTVLIKNFGCSTLPVNDMTVFGLVAGPGSAHLLSTKITIPDSLHGYEIYSHTFDKIVDMSIPGEYIASVSTTYPGDTDPSDDKSPESLVRKRPYLDRFMIDFDSSHLDYEDEILKMNNGTASSLDLPPFQGRDSTYGIVMEGSWGYDFRLVESFPLWGGPPVNVFDFNQEFSSFACLCIDATQTETLTLSFDLKQHFSSFFRSRFNNNDSIMASQGNNLRVLIDGNEIARYNPITEENDPFQTHNLDLSNYIGTSFTVCFEGKTIWSKAEDPNKIGDRIFIDNIRTDGIFTHVENSWNPRFTLYPNPTTGNAFLLFEAKDAQSIQVIVTDVTGRTIYQQEEKANLGTNKWELPSKSLSSGIYWISLTSSAGTISRKLMVGN